MEAETASLEELDNPQSTPVEDVMRGEIQPSVTSAAPASAPPLGRTLSQIKNRFHRFGASVYRNGLIRGSSLSSSKTPGSALKRQCSTITDSTYDPMSSGYFKSVSTSVRGVQENDLENVQDRDPSEFDKDSHPVVPGVNDDKTKEERSQENEDLEDANCEQKQSASSYLKEQFFSFFQPSDNKLAMKLFGNKNALMKEKRRQQQHGRWIVHPCSSFRFYWDLVMLVLLIANLIVLPVAISFFNDDFSSHWIAFNCLSDTTFLLDIVVNFRTGIITNDYADEIILNPKEIARQYVRTWFFLDFFSSIPMDYIFFILKEGHTYSQFVNAGRTLRIFRLVKLLSMLRLLRLSRLVRYVSQWEEFLNVASKFMGIFNLVLLMLLLGHWNACMQYLIPMLMDFPDDSWVAKCKLIGAPWFSKYTWALFKAMSHMLTMGYGRFPPTSIAEAWITIVSMMTGATCYALFVGHAAALIQSFDTSHRLYNEKFKQVEEYMAYRKLPRPLRQRIANYYEHRYQGKMFNENCILDELSECIREHIINYNCRALVAAVPFFTYADQDFVSEVVTKLQFEVFQPGDIIIKEGTIGTKMYFIQEGIVDIITREGDVATSLSDGSYFGEICLLTNAKRVASVRAETYCNLYSLDRDSFLSVLHNYPLMRRTLESVAAERLNKIGQNPCIVTTREDLNEDLNLVKEIVRSVSPLVSDSETSGESDNEHDMRDSHGRHYGNSSASSKSSRDDGSMTGEHGSHRPHHRRRVSHLEHNRCLRATKGKHNNKRRPSRIRLGLQFLEQLTKSRSSQYLQRTPESSDRHVSLDPNSAIPSNIQDDYQSGGATGFSKFTRPFRKLSAFALHPHQVNRDGKLKELPLIDTSVPMRRDTFSQLSSSQATQKSLKNSSEDIPILIVPESFTRKSPEGSENSSIFSSRNAL